VRALDGKVAVVTGAGRGLGKAVAEALDAEGCSVVLGARSTPEIDALAATLQSAVAVQTDVRSARDVDQLVGAAVAEFGRLDIMVNNAGVLLYGPAETVNADQVDATIDTNLKGVIYGSVAALRAMAPQRSGLIVNVASVAGKLHLPNESIYGASKWGVVGYTGVLRLEAAAHGVKVCCICPGGIDTPAWREMDFYPFPEGIDPERDFLDPAEVATSIVDVARTSDRFVVPELVVAPLLHR
jgi:2-deoxy-D-gluconate 3-dehydrogenase